MAYWIATPLPGHSRSCKAPTGSGPGWTVLSAGPDPAHHEVSLCRLQAGEAKERVAPPHTNLVISKCPSICTPGQGPQRTATGTRLPISQ